MLVVESKANPTKSGRKYKNFAYGRGSLLGMEKKGPFAKTLMGSVIHCVHAFHCFHEEKLLATFLKNPRETLCLMGL